MSNGRVKTVLYYCDNCGIEIHGNSRLCSGCAKEEKIFHKKHIRKDDDTFIRNSKKSGKHSRTDSGRK